MKIRKILAAITSVALVGTMLAGCNNDGNSTSTPNSPANNNSTSGNGGNSTPVVNDEVNPKITVWGSQAEQDMLKEMCDAFAAANPDLNVTFEYGVVGEDTCQEQVLKDIEAAGDVFAFPLDQFPKLADAGALFPITQNLDKIKAENTENNLNVLSRDGQLFAYPNVAETLCLFYNKSMITDEEAKSVESILAKDTGATINLSLENGGFYTGGFFFANGCTLFGADGNDPTQCDFASDAGVEVGNYLFDLLRNPKATAVDVGNSYVITNFGNGTLAAAISGPWNAKEVQEALGENFGVAKLPTINIGGTDKQLQCFANLKAMGVNSKTKFPKTACAVAEWLTNAENQAKRAELRNLGAVNTTVDVSKFADNPTIAAVSEQSKYTTPAIHVSMIGDYWTAMQTFGDSLNPNGSATKDGMKEALETTVTGITTGIGS